MGKVERYYDGMKAKEPGEKTPQTVVCFLMVELDRDAAPLLTAPTLVQKVSLNSSI